jgi:hypothetical protein
MTGVSAINKCPICNGPMETYLETKTSEFEGVCRGACGYSSFAEIESDSVTELKYWVETQFFPMSKDGTMVARPGGQHKWNNNEFPSADPTETVPVLRYLNADSLTGKYAMSVDGEGNKTAPPIEWGIGAIATERLGRVAAADAV